MAEGAKRGGVAEVARQAGVSPATVSRAFNLPDLVNAEVLKHIHEVAARLGYSPNPAAKALRSRRTQIVGAAIPTLDYAIFASVMHAFQDTFAAKGYTTIVLTTGFDNRQVFDRVKLLLDRGAEAILLIGSVEDPRLRDFIATTPVPMITTFSHLPGEIVPSVGIDNHAATTEAVQHLLSLGHRHFAMIAGETEGNDRQTARVRAFREAVAAAGACGADCVLHRGFGMKAGAEAMGRILADRPETTAVVCNTDIFAIGAMAACRERGVKVPAEVSIVGFDDQDYAELIDPPLTTLAVPAAAIGTAAAERLLAALLKGETPGSLLLPARLVLRGSTAPPRR